MARRGACASSIVGFALKIGLVPLHVWMPLAYTAAPIPAAAVLSGAAVKAGVIGLIRFLPLGAAMPGWGEALVALGFFSAFYGVAVGITQANPKTVLAYSSVSQMGVIAAVLGMGAGGAATKAPRSTPPSMPRTTCWRRARCSWPSASSRVTAARRAGG